MKASSATPVTLRSGSTRAGTSRCQARPSGRQREERMAVATHGEKMTAPIARTCEAEVPFRQAALHVRIASTGCRT